MLNHLSAIDAAFWIVFCTCLGALYWVYDGYGRCLQLLTTFRRTPGQSTQTPRSEHDEALLPSVSVLVTAHNEAGHIAKRIRNLQDCNFPADRLEIVVAADGCTDATCDIVRHLIRNRTSTEPAIRLYESPGLGKTATQNGAIADIRADVIVFTDADVVFDHQFLRSAAGQFLDPQVGAVAGHLLFAPPGEHAVISGQGFFWNYELKLRRLETQLGLLAVVAGSCFALRRSLFVEMNPSIGEDCIVPLDVVNQGFRVVQDDNAVCFDQFEYGADVVWRKRIRMTLRNWQGTWLRSSLLNPFKSTGYAFALWSHKLGRWLSPVFLLGATISGIGLNAISPGPLTIGVLSPLVCFYLLAFVGWLTKARGIRIPGAATCFSFLLVNAAFFLGVVKALSGHQIHSYRNFLTSTRPDEATHTDSGRQAA
ncbi:MAG: glycosyltransferase [Planctomycetaceae bacterium]